MQQLLVSIFSKLTVKSVIDILAVAVLIYQFVLMIRGRHAVHILTGISVLVLIYFGAVGAHLDLLRSALAGIAPYSALVVMVLFQSEIRRLLARIGRFRWLGRGGQLERREIADEIVLAVQNMAQAKI